MGFEMLREAGLQLFILSKEANPVVAARGRKVNVPVIQNVHDKGQALDALARDNGIDLSRAIYVGNDLNDLPAMAESLTRLLLRTHMHPFTPRLGECYLVLVATASCARSPRTSWAFLGSCNRNDALWAVG